MPVTSHSASSSSTSSSSQPWVQLAGAAGMDVGSPGRAATASQIFGLYFMVHEPERVGAEVDGELAVARAG